MMRTYALCGLLMLSAAAPCVAETTPARLWLRSWNGPANHSDEPDAVLALPDHSVIIAGESYDPGAGGHHPTLLCYDADGNLLWSDVEPGFAKFHGLHRSSTGDVYLSGMKSVKGVWNLLLRRLDPATGRTVWEAAHPASFSSAPFTPAVAEDPATGSVLVAASLAGDFLMLRFALDSGEFMDEHVYDGPQHADDRGTAIAPLVGGGFVIAGTEGGMAHGYRTIACSNTGGILWSDHENGPIGNVFTPAWVAVDPDGNVLVGGGPETTCGLFQFRAWKISPAGQRLWTVAWPTANCASAEPYDFAMATDGSIAMAGQTNGSSNDIAVLHVDPAGAMWTRTWDGPVHGVDGGRAIGADPLGNIIVAGFAGAPGGNDIAAAGWSAVGDLLFSRTDSAIPSANDFVTDLSLDGAGSFAIVSSAFSAAQNSNIYTSRYQRQSPPGDISGDGAVDIDDLLAVINAWGPCPASCPADLNGSGIVDIDDLLTVINGWT